MADRKISEFTDGGLVQTDDEIAAVRGGQNYKVTFGSAAALDAGVDVGDVVALTNIDGVAGLPAVDGSQLLNLPSNPTGLSKVSVDDAALSYLEDKIVAGSNISINKITDSSGAEVLEIESSGGGGGTVYLSDIQNIADGRIVSNISGSSAPPAANSISDVLSSVGVVIGDNPNELIPLDSDGQIPLAQARRKEYGPYYLNTSSSHLASSIPSWVKRITITFDDALGNSQSFGIRVGTSGGIASSGYLSNFQIITTTVANSNPTDRWQISSSAGGAKSGVVILQKLATLNNWQISSQLAGTDRIEQVSGKVALAGVLDRVEIVSAGLSFTGGIASMIMEG